MNQTITLGGEKQPWYKHRWPWLLIAGPATVVVAGVVTLVLAVNSYDGLVTDDYYKQGLTVNQRLQRDHAASQLGLHADVMRAGQNIRLLITSSAGATALPVEITFKLAHPTRAGQDDAVKMVSEGQGFYTGKLGADVSGRWLVSIEDPAGKWRLQGEWHADSLDPLRLSAKADK